MKTQITEIIGNVIANKSNTEKVVTEIMDLIFQGKENHFTIAPAIFKKIKIEGGHLYCFWNDIIKDWERHWAFVPDLPE